jgi:hypothetical protein
LTVLGALALLWIGFLVFIAKTRQDTHHAFLLGAWGVMILGSIVGIAKALF